MDPPTELEDENPEGAELLEDDPIDEPPEGAERVEDDSDELERLLELLENQDELSELRRREGSEW